MLLTIVAVCGIIAAFFINPGSVMSMPSNSIGIQPIHTWIDFGITAMITNLVISLGIGYILYILNREFKLMRDKSEAVAGLFMLMQMALPQAMYTFTGGPIFTIVMLACMFILFSIYNSGDCSRTIFTVFLLLGTGSLTFYGYLFFIPLFLIGCAQVRVLTLRTFVAALLGSITPAWIAAGFGLIDPSFLLLPDIDTILATLEAPQLHLPYLITAGFTVIICLLFGVGCAIRSYSYNSQSRAYNGFIYIMILGTILMSFIDFNSAIIYLPLLNCCAAYQIGHFFITNHNPHSVIGILLIVAAYFGLYFWNVL